MTVNVAGMSYGACVRHVTRPLDGMSGVVHVRGKPSVNQATIEHFPAFVDAAALIVAVECSSPMTRTITDSDCDPRQPEGAPTWLRLRGVAQSGLVGHRYNPIMESAAENSPPIATLLENHRAFLRYLERRVGDRTLAEESSRMHSRKSSPDRSRRRPTKRLFPGSTGHFGTPRLTMSAARRG